MYKLKPYYDPSLPVELPNCMYKMKTLTGTEISATKNCTDQLDVGYLAQLETRQEDILRRLESLKAEVAGLVKTEGASAEAVKTCALTDLVVSADPSSSPPLAVLVLTQMLASQYRVLAACHCHSSVSNVPENLTNVFGESDKSLNRGDYHMVLTLVWKAVKHGPTLMVNPRSQVLLEGEGTIARHLARLLDSSYEGDIAAATEIDQWVDTAPQYAKGNNKEKNSVLKSMNSKLGKSNWLVGESLSLADVMMWGVLVGSNVPVNVTAWLKRCSERKEFVSVLKQLRMSV